MTQLVVVAWLAVVASCGEVKSSGGDASSGTDAPPMSGDPDASEPGPGEPDATPVILPDGPPGSVCQPGTATCVGDQLTACNGDGQHDPAVTCALGCFTDGTRCRDVAPLFDLAAALDLTARGPAIVLPDGAIFDTTAGSLIGSGGTPIAVETRTVTTTERGMVRVFIVGSLEATRFTIQGNLGFALVSNGPVVIRGLVSANARGRLPGPGNADCRNGFGADNMPNGNGLEGHYASSTTSSGGGGGGGSSGVSGSRGGSFGTVAGGAGGRLSTVRRTGCWGGDVTLYHDDDGEEHDRSVIAGGGAGGGAVHIVSRSRISIVSDAGGVGAINTGGGGGAATGGGGGGGGSVILEAPIVTVTGPGAAVASNGGGGGGGCPLAGQDGLPSGVAALGGQCTATGQGPGGAGGNLTGTVGTQGGSVTATGTRGGGGGGAAGSIRILTSTGAFTRSEDAVVSPAAATMQLGTR